MAFLKIFFLEILCLLHHTHAKNGPSNELLDQISLNFLLNNQQINLHLIKTENTNQELIDFIIAQTNFNPNNQEKSYYEDHEKKGVFIVTKVLKDAVESNLYHGFFEHGEKTYTVEPAIGRETDIVKLEEADYSVKEFIAKDMPTEKRTKRATRKELVVEVMMVADFTVYQKFMKRSNNNSKGARSRLFSYYAQIVNQVDGKFRSIKTSRYSYSVHTTDLYICESKEDSMFTMSDEVQNEGNKINYLTALNKFNEWLKSKPSIDHYDVAAFFTTFNEGEDVQGMAYDDAVCEDNRVCGVTDNGIIATAISMAHEIGHLLGSKNDALTTCSDSYQFVMSTSKHVGQDNFHTFSFCSISSFQEHMDKLESETKNCLYKDKVSGKKKDITKALTDKLGLKYSANTQCQFLYGPNSKLCSLGKASDEGKCEELPCFHPLTNTCKLSIGSIALDGTPCGQNKWCMNKKCVHTYDAPTNTESCQHGDITIDPDYYQCAKVFENPNDCYGADIEDQCCASCKKVATGIPDCMYGDRSNQCEIGICVHKKNLPFCCKTCANEVSAAPETPA